MKNSSKKFYSTVMVILLLISMFFSGVTVDAKQVSNKDNARHVIVIDPGCQANKATKKESNAPGEWKRVSEDAVGAKGVSTNNNEYDINLLVALAVKKKLDEKGYTVELTRTTNDVNLTNVDRSMVATTLSADIYISIHASSKNKDDEGIAVVCGTKDNPSNFGQYPNSRLLADTLVGSLVEKAAPKKYKVYETDELMGINWCTVPNVVVEIGNMNNPDDDEKLADIDYQDKLADGIVAGVDSYFSQR